MKTLLILLILLLLPASLGNGKPQDTTSHPKLAGLERWANSVVGKSVSVQERDALVRELVLIYINSQRFDRDYLYLKPDTKLWQFLVEHFPGLRERAAESEGPAAIGDMVQFLNSFPDLEPQITTVLKEAKPDGVCHE